MRQLSANRCEARIAPLLTARTGRRALSTGPQLHRRARRSPRIARGIRALMAAGRERTNARLERALEFPLTLICAPPGFSRLTAVCDVLQARGQAYRRVHVDPFDADVLSLMRALAVVVSDFAPAFKSTFVSVFDRVADAPDAAEQLAEWTAEHLRAVNAVFVIDAFETMGGEAVAAFLTALVERTPETLRWVIIADAGDRFPIARWLAESRIDVPIDAGDLALTDDDLQRAAGRTARRSLRPRLRGLSELTGGWPAALTLAIAVHPLIDAAGVPRERPELYAHLADMLLSMLTARDRAFLDATCFFHSFDAALLAYGEVHAAARTIAVLTDLGLLCMDNSGACHYGNVFAAFLHQRLRTRTGGAYARAAAAAARAYEHAGRFAEALALRVELRDEPAVSELLSAQGFALLERGEAHAVQRALQLIPHDVLLAYPAALAVKASLESLHGKFDVAEAWFRLALDRVGDGVARDDIVYRFAIDLVRRERPDAIDVLAPAVAALGDGARLAAPLLALLATAYASNRQHALAAAAIDRALWLLPCVDDRATRAKIVYQAGYVALILQDIQTAKARARQAHREATECYVYDVAARALSVLYNIALDYEDDIGAGRRYLEQLAEVSVRAGSRALLLYSTLCRYELEVNSANGAEIDRLNDRLASLDVYFSRLTSETLLPAQALQASWNKDFYRAFRLLEPSAEHQIDPHRRAFRYAEIAVYAAAAGLRKEAATAAQRALSILRRARGADTTALHALAYVALAFVLLRRHARAAELLAEVTLRSAGSERIARLVRVVGCLAARWLGRAATADLGAELDGLAAHDLGGLARLIEALPLPETARSQVAQLTLRERRVLASLAQGASSVQIAVAEGCSSRGVELYIGSLCRKLGCADRSHAVGLAQHEGLLTTLTAAMAS